MMEYIKPLTPLGLGIYATRAWVRYLMYGQNFIIAYFIMALIVKKHSVRYLRKVFTVSLSTMVSLSLIFPALMVYLVLHTAWGESPKIMTMVNAFPLIVLTTATAIVYYMTYTSIKSKVHN